MPYLAITGTELTLRFPEIELTDRLTRKNQFDGSVTTLVESADSSITRNLKSLSSR